VHFRTSAIEDMCYYITLNTMNFIFLKKSTVNGYPQVYGKAWCNSNLRCHNVSAVYGATTTGKVDTLKISLEIVFVDVLNWR